MIISRIIGGLGNQMFQYALGRALSLEREQPLRLDISDFTHYRLHQGFELRRVFNCPAETAEELEGRRILGWQFSRIPRRILARPAMAAFRRNGFVVEPHFHYWSKIHEVPQDCYLTGYWQSEKYFKAQASVIRADFTFKSSMTKINADLAKKISTVNSVSLHVRRGDYINNHKTNRVHGVCSIDYYKSAIRNILDRVDKPCFFFFSDDIPWAMENLKIDMPCQYISHNQGVESYNDMRLMSVCKHHIIANSSFSWWGAWLNPNPNKIVVAPQRWFSKSTNTTDLIPENWLIA